MEDKTKDKNKKKGIFKYVLIFLLGLFLSRLVFVGLNRILTYKVVYTNKDYINHSSYNSSDSNNSDEDDSATDKSNTDNKTNPGNNNSSTVDKSKEEKTPAAIPEYNYNPNNDGYVAYNLTLDNRYIETSFGTSNFILYKLSGDDMKTCKVQINKDNILNTYGPLGVSLNSNETTLTATIKFDTPVKYVIHGGRGQAASKDDSMLFLMQDGTVRYLKIVDALTSTEFKSNYKTLPTPKKINNLSNITEIYSGSYRSLTPGVIGGSVDTIAVKNDGTLIHIMDFV